MFVHGDGSAARDWLFVEDHCRALDAIIHAPANKVLGRIFNLGVQESRSILEIAAAVQEIMKAPNASIRKIDNRPGQVHRHTCDASLAKSVLGWEPQVKFHDALEKTVEFYRNNQDWWASQMWMRSVEITTELNKKVQH